MGGRRVGRLLRAALVGVAATLATGWVQYLGPEVIVSNLCDPPDAPGCVDRVLVAGLPLWWVSDSPWVSAVGTVTPFVEDPVRGWAFGVDVLAWGAAFGAAAGAGRRRRARR